MNWMLNVLAVIMAFGYAFYVRAILRGNADLTEKSLMSMLADWFVENGAKSQRKIWIVYWVSLFLEAGYLYLALTTVENVAFRILTAGILGIEMYAMAKWYQRIWGFFHGKRTFGEIFVWKMERISAMALFTHAILVLLFPLATWF